MVKYTVKSLIDELSRFPADLNIETELSLMWNYPFELLEVYDDTDTDDFEDLTCRNAVNLCIFEGSWDDSISDIDGKYNEFYKPCGDGVEIKEDYGDSIFRRYNIFRK